MNHRRDLIFFSDGFSLGIYCSIASMIMNSMVGCIIKVLIACLKSSPVLGTLNTVLEWFWSCVHSSLYLLYTVC